MICGDVCPAGEGLLAEVTVCCCCFEVGSLLAIVSVVVEGAPRLAYSLSFSFTLIYPLLMCCTVASPCG